MKRRYDIAEKKEIIIQSTGLSESLAWKIAYNLDFLTFGELRKLVEAMRIIAEGKEE